METKHYDFSKRIFKIAWGDTVAFFKKRIAVGVSFLFSVIVGAGFFYLFYGNIELEKEIGTIVAFVLAPFGLFAFLLFLWNLSIAPFKLVYEKIGASSARPRGQTVQFDLEEPDYDIWDMINEFTLADASNLLAGQKTTMRHVTDESKVWLNVILDAVEGKEIHLKGPGDDPNQIYVTRKELVKFAKARNKKPPFLFPEERGKPNAWMAK